MGAALKEGLIKVGQVELSEREKGAWDSPLTYQGQTLFRTVFAAW